MTPDPARWPSFPAANVRSGRYASRVAAEAMRGRSFPMAMTGTVKFFNGERGYGFIKPDDGGRDVFVHITAVERAGIEGSDRRTAHHIRGRTGQEGQGPQGGQSGDFVVSSLNAEATDLGMRVCQVAAEPKRASICRSEARVSMRSRDKKIPAARRPGVVRIFSCSIRSDSSRLREPVRSDSRLSRR